MRIIMHKLSIMIIFTVLSLLTFSACVSNSTNQDLQNNPQAETIIEVTIPGSISLENNIYLEILDEVTGLGLNRIRYQMGINEQNTYSLILPLVINSVVKYRYVRGGNPPLIEYDSQGVQVRYRIYHVKSPSVIHDQIAGWQDSSYEGKTGTLQGFIYDESSSRPISNVMVIIAGMRTFTGEDGAYTITGIPVGEHRLTAYHVDCLYQNFQQDAVIAANATTPANFGMKSSPLVNITFQVTPPIEHMAGAPVRLIGNLLSTGNTFMDLRGGLNILARNVQNMNFYEDGTYATTLSIPSGCYFEYKYSLGDGFWNAEHESNGKWKLRKIIIPSKDMTINDRIDSWKDNDSYPITLNITTPSDTPSNGIVAIEFNPFVWMEPISIWNLGRNQWLYMLYSPLNFINNASFRVLLNDSSGRKDDIATQGENPEGIKISPSQTSIDYIVNGWVPK